jgi:hypothetical protein
MSAAEETYDKNLDLWAHSHPREAIWLQYFECKNIEIVRIENEMPNLKRIDDNGELLFYENPQEEAEEWVGNLDLSNSEVLYIYGVGLGYYYVPLKNWLNINPDHHIVFLEDDLEVIARLFETDIGTDLLSDPQVSLYFFRDISETEMIFNHLFWNFPMAKIAFGALKHYAKTKTKKYDELRHQISYDAAVKNSLLEEYLQYGIAFYRNFYSNLLQLNQSYLGNSLFGKLESIPAIICGAGPSLQKNITLLKTLSKRAIIFAGSSALNALGAAGIQPHLGAGIDPNQMQEERLKNVKNLHFPFLYRNRMYPKALHLVTGPKLYVTGSGGYEIADWFEKKFGIEGKYIEEGRNVVNFCLEAAHQMGCNPIIFVGMDLAFTGLKAYTEGVVPDPSVTKEEYAASNDFNKSAVLRKDIFGNDIYTVWKWVSEAKWMGDFAESHSEITLINATEGGLGFPGIPNKTLRETSDEHLINEYEIQSKIESLYKPHSLSGITKVEIVNAIKELREGLQRCLEYLQILNEENEKVKEEMKKGSIPEHLLTGRAVMTETELADDLAFIHVLQIFNDVSTKLMQRDLMKINNPANKASQLEREFEKLELNSQKYKYLMNVAKVNIELINHALQNQE